MVELSPQIALIAEADVIVNCHAKLRTPSVIKDHIVKAGPVTLRVHMQLAHRLRLISGLLESRRQSRDLGVRQRIVEHPVPVRARRHAGHQSAPRRDAHGMHMGHSE